ncbi:MAG: hypothetical protein J5793_04750, partial [Clostridia bacterium]|nr:hypothetical protein [Clostridia bacterium]
MFYIVVPRLRLRISVFALPVLIFMLSVEGAIPFCILFLSALIHEAGHLAALRSLSARPRRIDVLPMGALIVCPEGLDDASELRVALAGPAFSLLAAALCALLFAAAGSEYALFGSAVNLFLAAFNLLPGKKLDGGKALYCLISIKNRKDTAERICS